MSSTIPSDDSAKGHEAVRAAAKGEANAVERSEALAWFLDPDAEEEASHDIKVKVSGERYVTFKVQVLERERIREIRQQCENNDGRVDESEANLRILVESLIDPPLNSDQRLLTVRGVSYVDPADALKARFAHKPGLIDQMATKAVELSGYGDRDVLEVEAGKS